MKTKTITLVCALLFLMGTVAVKAEAPFLNETLDSNENSDLGLNNQDNYSEETNDKIPVENLDEEQEVLDENLEEVQTESSEEQENNLDEEAVLADENIQVDESSESESQTASYYYLEEQADRFTLEKINNQYYITLKIGVRGIPTFELNNPKLYIREHADSSSVEIEMSLVSQNEKEIVYQVIIEEEAYQKGFETSFSIDLQKPLMRTIENRIEAFTNDQWIRVNGVNGERGYVIYDSRGYHHTDGHLRGITFAQFSKLPVAEVIVKITSEKGSYDLEYVGKPASANDKIMLSLNYKTAGRFSNEWVKIEYISTYTKLGKNYEVYSDPEYVYVGVEVSVDETKSEMKAQSVHIEGLVNTYVQIPTLENDLIVRIRLKGSSDWLLLDPRNFTAVYNQYNREYKVVMDADLEGILSPELGSFYEIQFELSTSRTSSQHGTGTHTAYGQGTIKYRGWAYKELFTFKDGIIASQTQEYSPGVLPSVDLIYTQTEGTEVEQHEYYGYSLNEPASMDDVTIGLPPAYTHAEQVIYLIYVPAVKIIQVPALFRFDTVREDSGIYKSKLDLSQYSKEDLDRGKESLFAITNLAPKDQSFDLYVSFAPMDNGKEAASENFELSLKPTLVKIVNHGQDNQTLNTNVSNNKPVLSNVILKSNGESKKILASPKANNTYKLAIWGLKFTEENTELSRPLEANSGKYKSEIHWELKTGLKVSE